MSVDITQLSEGWLELESDPGLFTLLLEDFGVKGVQVEEIYDLQKPIENTVYGFIFLFRWTEERRSRRKIFDKGNIFVKDEEIVNNIFFAQQMVPNSCATHALLSVLLNCPTIQLGEILNRLKIHTAGMGPENKGWAIGNTPELAKAHNSHASSQALHGIDKTAGVSTGKFVGDAFHFVSYVPINGHLFELDGLKPYPIDHGPWSDHEDWTDKFQCVIKDRLGVTTDEVNDIRYNLMAVVPDKRLALTHKLNMLKTNRQIVLEAHQQLQQLDTGSLSPILLENSSQLSPNRKRPISPSKIKVDGSEASGDNKMLKIFNTQLKLEPNDDSESPCVPELENNDKKTDYSTPLTIQTSPASCSTSSTDTSSEVGSAFNSPGLNSPYPKDFNKFVVIRVATAEFGDGGSKPKESSVKKVCLEAGALPAGWEKPSSFRVPCRKSLLSNDKKIEDRSDVDKMESSHHTFSPKDLLALVKHLDSEIGACEGQLKEEQEKRKRYKIDDCRRVHNYDEFICTFLSMLAQQRKIADLIQQQLYVQRKHLNPVSSSVVSSRNFPTNKKHVSGNKKRGRSKNQDKK